MKLKHIIILTLILLTAISPWTMTNQLGILGILSVFGTAGLVCFIGTYSMIYWNSSFKEICKAIIKSFK
jgi:cobalamin biosynthesis protein CbiD